MFGLATTFLEIDGIRLHTFFLLTFIIISGAGVICCKAMDAKTLTAYRLSLDDLSDVSNIEHSSINQYAPPMITMLKISIDTICTGLSTNENPLSPWEDGETIGGNI